MLGIQHRTIKAVAVHVHHSSPPGLLYKYYVAQQYRKSNMDFSDE